MIFSTREPPVVPRFAFGGGNETYRITRINIFDATGEVEIEYVLSATHYFFVWPVESIKRVRADNHLLLKKRD